MVQGWWTTHELKSRRGWGTATSSSVSMCAIVLTRFGQAIGAVQRQHEGFVLSVHKDRRPTVPPVRQKKNSLSRAYNIFKCDCYP